MSNILPLDSSIQLLAGQRVVRIGEYFFPVGVGGNFTPGSGASPAKYYKCQSVDTATSTWSGYSAIDRGTYYEFEELPTTGLKYIGYAPETDSVYSEDGRVKIASLFNGLIAEESESGDTVYTVYMPGTTTVSDTTMNTSDASVSDGVLSFN